MSLVDGVFFDTSTRGDVVSLGLLDQDRGIIAFRGRPMRLRALTKEMREEKEKAPGTKLSFCLGMGIFFPSSSVLRSLFSSVCLQFFRFGICLFHFNYLFTFSCSASLEGRLKYIKACFPTISKVSGFHEQKSHLPFFFWRGNFGPLAITANSNSMSPIVPNATASSTPSYLVSIDSPDWDPVTIYSFVFGLITILISLASFMAAYILRNCGAKRNLPRRKFMTWLFMSTQNDVSGMLMLSLWIDHTINVNRSATTLISRTWLLLSSTFTRGRKASATAIRELC